MYLRLFGFISSVFFVSTALGQSKCELLAVVEFQEGHYYANLDSALNHVTDVWHLDLQNQDLTSVPDEIRSFANLQILDLSHNQITVLPEWLPGLTSLNKLYINHNQILSLEPLTLVTGLNTLYAQHNPVCEIKLALSNSKKLEVLWLGGCTTELKLPESFWSLTTLKTLRITEAGLKLIPSSISQLAKLEVLCINDNRIANLPESLFDLKGITYLSVGNNVITRLSERITEMENLYYLGVFGNDLTDLPDQVADLRSLKFLSAWDLNLTEARISHFTSELLRRNNDIKISFTSYGIK